MGIKKKRVRQKRNSCGKMSHAMTRAGSPWVMSQKSRIDMIRGSVTVAASLYIR